MLEDVSKGLIYNVNNYTMIDKKTGKEVGMIHISYIYENSNKSATNIGWQHGQAYMIFTDDLFKFLKSVLLKNVDLKFNLVADYNDNTRFTLKLVKVNDFSIKQ